MINKICWTGKTVLLVKLNEVKIYKVGKSLIYLFIMEINFILKLIFRVKFHLSELNWKKLVDVDKFNFKYYVPIGLFLNKNEF